MLNQTPGQRIYLAAEPVDMRGGFDRLAGRVRAAGLDLYAGHLFVFVSVRRTHLKVLTWDGSGLVVFYKVNHQQTANAPPCPPGNARTFSWRSSSCPSRPARSAMPPTPTPASTPSAHRACR
jgi:hypothetical protein